MKKQNVHDITKDGYLARIEELAKKAKDESHIITAEDVDEEAVHWDRCKKVWESYYEKMYKDCLELNDERLYNLNRLKGYARRIRISEDCTEIVSGDVTFNFGKEKQRNLKYERYKAIIMESGSDATVKAYMLRKLDSCSEMNYSFENLTLMVTTGGLNLVKNNQGGNLDRPDAYIALLQKYFNPAEDDAEKKEYRHKVFSRSRNNEAYLHRWLKELELGGIKAYCQLFWAIDDEDFLKEMCELGKREIKSAYDVNDYMNLAIDFWEMRFNRFQLIINGSSSTS